MRYIVATSLMDPPLLHLVLQPANFMLSEPSWNGFRWVLMVRGGRTGEACKKAIS